MKEDKVINKESRRITSTYTLDNNYRVKVITFHSTTAKAIRSLVSECIHRQELNYAMETHRMFSDFSQVITTEHVARYSFKTLQDQHDRAVKLSAQIVADLLAQGEKNERECQKEVA